MHGLGEGGVFTLVVCCNYVGTPILAAKAAGEGEKEVFASRTQLTGTLT